MRPNYNGPAAALSLPSFLSTRLLASRRGSRQTTTCRAWKNGLHIRAQIFGPRLSSTNLAPARSANLAFPSSSIRTFPLTTNTYRPYIPHLYKSSQRSIFRCRSARIFKRQASSGRTRTWSQKEVEIPVGGSGSVRLDVFSLVHLPHTCETGTQPYVNHTEGVSGLNSGIHLEDSSSLRFRQRSVVLVYLPSGPFPRDVVSSCENEFESILAKLGRTFNSHDSIRNLNLKIVKVNYRLEKGTKEDDQTPDLRFPIPIHDAAMCFEAIVKQGHLLMSDHELLDIAEATNTESGFRESEIFVIGSHIGGSLALALALTHPDRINAVAVVDPIVDWAGLDETAAMTSSEVSLQPSEVEVDSTIETSSALSSAGKRRSTKRSARSDSGRVQYRAAQAMINLRTSLFRTPSGFFDQFASPILFLRAPGKDTPRWNSARPVHQDIDGVTSTETFGPYDDDWHAVHHDYIDGGLSKAQGNPSQLVVDSGIDFGEAESIGIADSHPSYETQSSLLTAPNLDTLEHRHLATESAYMSANNTELDGKGRIDDGRTSTELLGLGAGSEPLSLFTRMSLDIENDAPKAVKRRKTLKRWPPVHAPEEALLPHIRIYSTVPLSKVGDQDHVGRDIDLAQVLHPQAKEMVEVMRRACFWGREKSLAEERVNIELFGKGEQNGEGSEEPYDRNGLIDIKSSRLCEWVVEMVGKNRMKD